MDFAFGQCDFDPQSDPMTSSCQVVNVEAGKNKGSASHSETDTREQSSSESEVHLWIALLVWS